jgi:hypothetical protein
MTYPAETLSRARAGRWLALALGWCLWGTLPLQAAGGRYGAVREAMQPPPPPAPVQPNPVRPPGFLTELPLLKPKAPLRQGSTPTPSPPAGAQPTEPLPEPSVKPEPLAPAAEPTLEPVAGSDRISIRGDHYEYTEGRSRVESNVELKYQDLTLRSRSAELDADRVWGTFEGDVQLQGPTFQGRGDLLRVNLDTEQWEMKHGRVTVEPDFAPEQVKEPLFVEAEEAEGDAQTLLALNAQGTTCDYETDQHFYLRSPRVKVIDGKAVTFVRPTLYILGHRIVRFPYNVTFSLERKQRRLLPELGVNDVEGYFAKLALGYALSAANTGFVRLHLTEKRGIGLGFDHLLDQERQSAEVSFFAEPEMSSRSGRISHRLQLSSPLKSEFSANWQENSGYGLGQRSIYSNLNFRYDTTDANTLLGFQQSYNSSGASLSHQFGSSLTHRQQLGTTGEYQLRTTMTRGNYHNGAAPDEELNTEFSWERRGGLYDLEVLTQKRYDLDASSYPGDDDYYSLNRVPDVSLSTDSKRFRLLRWLDGWDARGTLYLGQFQQKPDPDDLQRAGVALDLAGNNYRLSRWASARLAGRFRQFLYGEGSAQWTGEFSSELQQRLTGTWESRLSFSYGKTNGFSPLRTDYATSMSYAQLQIVRMLPDRLRLNASFGRDFHNGYYNDAIVASELMLSRNSRLEMQGGYSVELSQWRPLNLRWLYARGESWYHEVGVNYDLDNGELSRFVTDVDWSPSRLWRLQFQGEYSTYGGVEQADFKISRDLHCLAAQVTYSYATNEFLIGIGIKAFESPGRTFGVGSSGGYFDSGFGDQY